MRNILEGNLDFTQSWQLLDFGYSDSDNIRMDIQCVFTTFLSEKSNEESSLKTICSLHMLGFVDVYNVFCLDVKQKQKKLYTNIYFATLTVIMKARRFRIVRYRKKITFFVFFFSSFLSIPNMINGYGW